MSGVRIVLGVSALELDVAVDALDLYTDSEGDRLADVHTRDPEHERKQARKLLSHASRLYTDLTGASDGLCATSATHYATITLTGTGARDALYAALQHWIGCQECMVDDLKPGTIDTPDTKKARAEYERESARLSAARDLTKRVGGRS